MGADALKEEEAVEEEAVEEEAVEEDGGEGGLAKVLPGTGPAVKELFRRMGDGEMGLEAETDACIVEGGDGEGSAAVR